MKKRGNMNEYFSVYNIGCMYLDKSLMRKFIEGAIIIGIFAILMAAIVLAECSFYVMLDGYFK